MTRLERKQLYQSVLDDNDTDAQRELCLTDLFFLLVVGFERADVDCEWLYKACNEVQADPDGYLDLWAREHYKSTIITYALSIQDILQDPNITIGIFSHTKPIAKAFLAQIKREFEENTYLQTLFPEVLYENPRKDSPAWSLDAGIMVKRTSNDKEPTVSAFGLVDGQPTSKHFKLLVYDDVVTLESVSTPDQIEKTTAAFAMSLNLGAHGGKIRGIGTRYHYNDTYREILKRGTLTARIKKATDDGTVHGEPVFLDKPTLMKKRADMGPFVFSSQMLQDPTADSAQGFKREWLRYIPVVKAEKGWTRYLLVDPAGEKKKTNDYTVMVVIGLGPDGNYYLIDGIRDRLNLTERTDKLLELHRRWKPTKTGYEKYGKDSDIEHIKYVQDQENYRFEIVPLGGIASKNDRIRRMVPVFEQQRFYMPRRILFIDYEGNMQDFVRTFVDEEYEAFPVAVHDDMWDAISRIMDIGTVFPKYVNNTGLPGLPPKAHKANNTYDVLG